MFLMFGGSGFEPTQLPNLALWLDAADISTLFDAETGGSAPADNGNVGRWEDKSGNGNNGVQGTESNQPLYEIDEINGRPVLTCANDVLVVTDSTSLNYSEAQIFVVVRNNTDSGTADNRFFAKWSSNPNLEILAGFKNDGAPDSYNLGFATDATTRAFGDVNQVTLGDAAIIDFNITSASTDVRVNNANETTIGAGGYNGAADLLIGTSFGGGNFSLAEVIMYTDSLPVGDFIAVMNYLSEKWGITI